MKDSIAAFVEDHNKSKVTENNDVENKAPNEAELLEKQQREQQLLQQKLQQEVLEKAKEEQRKVVLQYY